VAIGSRPGAEQGRDADRAHADALRGELDQALAVAGEAVQAAEAEQARAPPQAVQDVAEAAIGGPRGVLARLRAAWRGM
jgi:hypothetical protein